MPRVLLSRAPLCLCHDPTPTYIVYRCACAQVDATIAALRSYKRVLAHASRPRRARRVRGGGPRGAPGDELGDGDGSAEDEASRAADTRMPAAGHAADAAGEGAGGDTGVSAGVSPCSLG